MGRFKGTVYGDTAVPDRKRQLIRDVDDVEAYHSEHQHGRDAMPELGHGQLEDLRQDLPDVRRMIEGGRSVDALQHVAGTVGVDPIDLMILLGDRKTGSAALIGWVQGILDQEDFVRQVRNPTQQQRQKRRTGYGRI